MHISIKHLAWVTGLVLCLQLSLSTRAIRKTPAQRKLSAGNKDLWVEYLAWQPRALLFHNFLSAEECQHLIDSAEPFMEKSSVVDNETGKSILDSVRTSSGMFLERGQDEVVTAIEEKIAMHTMLPVEHGEGLQILRYNHGEKYSSHYDYFHDTVNTANGGQRIATVLMYLSDVVEGGETVFPDSVEKTTAGKAEYSACAQAGVSVKPKKGVNFSPPDPTAPV